MTFLILIYIIFFFLIYLKTNKELYLYKQKAKKVDFQKSKLLSLVILIFFFFFYIVMFRVLRLFVNEIKYLDLNIYFVYFKYLIFNFECSDLFFVFFFLLFLLYFITEVKKIVYIYLRNHFVRIYFGNFCYYFVFFTKKVKDIEKKFLVKKYLNLYLFFRESIFKIFIFLKFFFDFIFNDRIIEIWYLKYFFIYYLLLIFYKFCLRFVIDFDYGIILSKNNEYVCVTEKGKHVLRLYIEFIITNQSSYFFFNSSLRDLFEYPNSRVLFFFYKNNVSELIELIELKKI